MKIVETQDYAQYLIQLGHIVRNINEAVNDREFELARMLAHEAKITAQLLHDALSKFE